MRDFLRMQNALDAFISRDDRAREDHANNRDAGQILDASIAERKALARPLARKPEGNRKRDRGRRVAKIMNSVGEQRDAAGDENDNELQESGGREPHERPLDGPKASVARRNR